MKGGIVKNPCKICFETVSTKNGLQCKGACKKWAHFKCLNYTPGKIQDIRAGTIKITCPCPDCNTSESNEVLINSPVTCTNRQCPANKIPKCVLEECPNNKSPILQPTPDWVPQKLPRPIPTETMPPAPPNTRATSEKQPTLEFQPKKQCNTPPCCQHKKKDTEFEPQISQSCSFLSTDSNISDYKPSEAVQVSSSESQLEDNKQDDNLFYAVEQMCRTVGHLSDQLKDLMCRMMNSSENKA